MRHRGHRVQAFRVQLYLLTDAAARRREVRFIVEVVVLLLPRREIFSIFSAPRIGPGNKAYSRFTINEW